MVEEFRPRVIRTRTVPATELGPTSVLGTLLDCFAKWPSRVRRSRRENAAFRVGFDSAWAYCKSVWLADGYVCAWGMLASYPQRPTLPYGVWLHQRFVREYASSFHRLQSEARSPSALIAAYAVLCMAANPNLIPHDVFGRQEEVTLRDLYQEDTMNLGDFASLIYDLRNDLS